jgi:hypothetical protein
MNFSLNFEGKDNANSRDNKRQPFLTQKRRFYNGYAVGFKGILR